ncbi:MAG: type II toxin-antitoxin system HicA family toxin [Acidobacteria bacterium]|nr:type II toxin-antitoxin system HicA family toxin [Acidobacteriota bacterium]
MAFPKHVWNQIRNITASEFARALERDAWKPHTRRGSITVYLKGQSPGGRVSVHFHSQKTFGPKLLQGMLNDTGWTEADLRRLKLIK